MEKKRFIPFDEETFLMIEDVTGQNRKLQRKKITLNLKCTPRTKRKKQQSPDC